MHRRLKPADGSSPAAADNTRHDIQFLRGFAVLAVVFFHANATYVPGGFLGVDVFFVISGFLITTNILKDLALGSFSFSGFYVRRAKRLLPAAYCTLIFTTLGSYVFLTSQQWTDYILQLLGTVTFSANVFLPFQTGYFEASAHGKPLLHTWSLSLEEQYYFFIPILLFLLAPRFRTHALVFGIALSFAICFAFVSFPFSYWRIPGIGSEVAAFYLLPTRAWELLFGSLLAWLMRQFPALTSPVAFKYVSLITLAIAVLFPIDSVHPRGGALVVVLATVVLLSGRDDWLPSNWLTRVVERVGDWSYSLYLVHWPLFAFAHLAYLGAVPRNVGLALIPISLVLACFQYRFVELRFRYGWQAESRKAFQWLAGASIMLFVVPAPAIVARLSENGRDLTVPKAARAGVVGLNRICNQGSAFSMSSLCMTAAKPRFAIWGDSYAMHLVPGLVADSTIGSSLVQITKAACAPIRGVASIDENYSQEWARGCLDFNERAIEYLRKSEHIKYVIMSSSFLGYFNEGELQLFYAGRKMIGARSVAIAQAIETIEALRREGKHPIIVAPPPSAGFDIGECWERRREGVLVMGRPDCEFLASTYQVQRRGVIDALKEIERRTAISIVWMDDVICPDATCQTRIDGNSLYWDGGHLTKLGSEFVVPKLNLGSRLEAGSER